jgi:hypothetical protein
MVHAELRRLASKTVQLKDSDFEIQDSSNSNFSGTDKLRPRTSAINARAQKLQATLSHLLAAVVLLSGILVCR